MVTTQEERSSTQVGLAPPQREKILPGLRRRWRSLSRHWGLRYWLWVYGLGISAVLAVLFMVNAFVIGPRNAYEVLGQFTSPWTVKAPWLALFLSLAGWVAIPGLVGAVVGQVVFESTDNRRRRSATQPSRGRDRRGRDYIPLLNRLLYEGHGFSVRPQFVNEFVVVHQGNWTIAQSHWEIMVGEYLNSVVTDEKTYVSPKQAMILAVREAANVLPPLPVMRCPRCPVDD